MSFINHSKHSIQNLAMLLTVGMLAHSQGAKAMDLSGNDPQQNRFTPSSNNQVHTQEIHYSRNRESEYVEDESRKKDFRVSKGNVESFSFQKNIQEPPQKLSRSMVLSSYNPELRERIVNFAEKEADLLGEMTQKLNTATEEIISGKKHLKKLNKELTLLKSENSDKDRSIKELLDELNFFKSENSDKDRSIKELLDELNFLRESKIQEKEEKFKFALSAKDRLHSALDGSGISDSSEEHKKGHDEIENSNKLLDNLNEEEIQPQSTKKIIPAKNKHKNNK